MSDRKEGTKILLKYMNDGVIDHRGFNKELKAAKAKKYLENKDEIEKLEAEYDKKHKEILKHSKAVDEMNDLNSQASKEYVAVWEQTAIKQKIKGYLTTPFAGFRHKKLENATDYYHSQRARSEHYGDKFDLKEVKRMGGMEPKDGEIIVNKYNNYIVPLIDKAFPIIEKKYALLFEKATESNKARNALVRESRNIKRKIKKLKGLDG